MKEISIDALRDYLKNVNLEYKPTQGKVSYPILERICKKLIMGERFRAINVDNGIIVNGHHRYICLTFLEIPVEISNWTLCPSAVKGEWAEVEVDILDWDPPGKVFETIADIAVVPLVVNVLDLADE